METFYYPSISIIIPCYNVDLYLDECIQSVVSQSYNDIEIILVDDGSPGATPQLCDKWANFDKRICVIHKMNGGLSSARNAGLNLARGKYVMFIDSDDTIEPDSFIKALNLIEKKKADIVGFGINKWNAGTKKPFHNRINGNVEDFLGMDCLKALLIGRIDCSACNKLYRRSVIGNLRFKEGVTNEDVLFLFELFQRTNLFSHLKECLYNYRTTPNSISTTISYSFFDVIRNISIMNDVIIERKLPVKQEMQIYCNNIYTMTMMVLFKKNAISLNSKYYVFCRNNVLKHYFSILFGSHYTFKVRIKCFLLPLLPLKLLRVLEK